MTSPSAAGLQIRVVRPEEHDALGELTVAAYSVLLGDHMSDGYRAELGDVAGRAGRAVVLAAVAPDGALLGGITYLTGPGSYEFSDGSEEEAGLRMLAVAPGAQRRGIGTALVRAAVERAHEEGRTRVLLHTTEWMTGAIRLYERLGFRRAPERDVRIPEVALLAYTLDLGPSS
ncbi:MAG: GNAT family N-acetyltransferase [Actinomycetota bacterium]|nr:GNAT family N-acetyltransferase [Actinomycetota bacterium]